MRVLQIDPLVVLQRIFKLISTLIQFTYYLVYQPNKNKENNSLTLTGLNFRTRNWIVSSSLPCITRRRTFKGFYGSALKAFPHNLKRLCTSLSFILPTGMHTFRLVRLGRSAQSLVHHNSQLFNIIIHI